MREKLNGMREKQPKVEFRFFAREMFCANAWGLDKVELFVSEERAKNNDIRTHRSDLKFTLVD